MNAVEFIQENKYYVEDSQIQIEADDQRCGEVFITANRTLVFHCCICESNFGSYDYFLDHLSTQHYEDVQGEVLEVDIKSSESDIDALLDDYCLDDGDFKDFKEPVNDDGENKEILQKIEIEYKPNVEKIEQIFIEEPFTFGDSENSFERLPDIVENDNEEQKLCTQPEVQSNGRPKKYKHTRKKSAEPFTCHHCGKIFKTNQKLRRHLVIHSDERKHECDICGFAFKERTNLDAHLRRHTGVKNISCGYCSKKFYTTSEAKNHRRTHTGERPYVCDMCGMSFTSAGGLNIHTKKHVSPPTYKCSYCDKGFYAKQDLNDHIVVHTKEKAFTCHICSAKFPRQKALIRHSKLHKVAEI